MGVGFPQWTVRVMSVVPSLIAVRDKVTLFKWKWHEVKLEAWAECIFTHRYWPPESTRYISSTVNFLLFSAVGLQHTKTGSNSTSPLWLWLKNHNSSFTALLTNNLHYYWLFYKNVLQICNYSFKVLWVSFFLPLLPLEKLYGKSFSQEENSYARNLKTTCLTLCILCLRLWSCPQYVTPSHVSCEMGLP